MSKDDKKGVAVVLLSGGKDSTTVLAMTKKSDFDVATLTFYYGQPRIEIGFAQEAARRYGVPNHVVDIDLTFEQFWTHPLLNRDIKPPANRTLEEMAAEIPATNIPSRNIVFLSIALAYAEMIGASRIYTGIIGDAELPDTKIEFLDAFQEVIETGSTTARKSVYDKGAITLRHPLYGMSTAQILKMGTEFGVDYSKTLTCYDPNLLGFACRVCDGCVVRRLGFEEAGIPDPTKYFEKETQTCG